MTRPAKPPRVRKRISVVVPPGTWTPETVRAFNSMIVCTAGDECAAWDEGSSPRCVHKCQAGNLWTKR
jgi:hypothetical protein